MKRDTLVKVVLPHATHVLSTVLVPVLANIYSPSLHVVIGSHASLLFIVEVYLPALALHGVHVLVPLLLSRYVVAH